MAGPYPNDQGNPAAAIPVRIIVGTDHVPVPSYPNDQSLGAGALPVYLAPPPSE